MKQTNQVFLQLREADKYALSKNPLLRRLAVVLLDNIVELQLSRKVQNRLYWDETTWYSGVRKFDRQLRYKVSRYHGELVRFAAQEAWITNEDRCLLEYAHDVRSRFYHEGDFDELDAELSIRLLYRFVDRYFPKWRGSGIFIELSPHDPIPIERAAEDSTGFCPLLVGCEVASDGFAAESKRVQSEQYWTDAMPRLLTYRPQDDIRQLIHRKANEFLDDLDRQRRFLTENYDFDFNWVLSWRFSVQTPAFVNNLRNSKKKIGLSGALNVYLAVLDDEEKLLDMKPNERANEFHRLVNAHKFTRNPLSWQEITGCRRKANKLLTMSEERGIGLFLEIEKDLRRVGRAVRELAFDLEGYNQNASDR